jgi:hypothetical protein
MYLGPLDGAKTRKSWSSNVGETEIAVLLEDLMKKENIEDDFFSHLLQPKISSHSSKRFERNFFFFALFFDYDFERDFQTASKITN